MEAKESRNPIWVSLVEVEALEDACDLARGDKAFVNALASATSSFEAEGQIQASLLSLGFHVVVFEDTEEWDRRISEFQVAPELIALAQLVEESGEPRFDTFHTWDRQG